MGPSGSFRRITQTGLRPLLLTFVKKHVTVLEPFDLNLIVQIGNFHVPLGFDSLLFFCSLPDLHFFVSIIRDGLIEMLGLWQSRVFFFSLRAQNVFFVVLLLKLILKFWFPLGLLLPQVDLWKVFKSKTGYSLSDSLLGVKVLGINVL